MVCCKGNIETTAETEKKPTCHRCSRMHSASKISALQADEDFGVWLILSQTSKILINTLILTRVKLRYNQSMHIPVVDSAALPTPVCRRCYSWVLSVLSPDPKHDDSLTNENSFKKESETLEN